MGRREGALERGEPERVGLVLFATIQGIAALVTAGMVQADQVDELVARRDRAFPARVTRGGLGTRGAPTPRRRTTGGQQPLRAVLQVAW